MITNSGELLFLETAIKTALSVDASLVLKLYTNNFDCLPTSIASDFTEATFTGYNSKTLSRATWGSATLVSGVGEIVYPVQSWTNSSASQTLVGWFIVDGSNNVLAAKRFDESFVIINGGTFNFVPAFGLRDRVV